MDEFLLYAKLKTFKHKVDKAHHWISEALKIDTRWSVSFSGGKDSTVLKHLVQRHAPDIDVVWFDDGWDYPETLEFINQTPIIKVSLPVSAGFWKNEIAYRGDDPAYLHDCDMTQKEWVKQYGGSFIGLRSEESKWRYFTFRYKGFLYLHKQLNHYHCCPLFNWSYRDIWAYILGNGIAYNPVYDKLAGLGVPIEQRRVGPLTAFMVYQYGALAIVKQGWPELFNRFASLHPEARSYV